MRTSVTHNLFAEFHVAVVDFSLPDKLTVWTPTQTGLLMQHSLAPAFGLSISQVQIIHLNTGGAFSGRGSIRPHHFIAALLSRTTRRPVKLFAAGDEEFLICRALGENEYRLKGGRDERGAGCSRSTWTRTWTAARSRPRSAISAGWPGCATAGSFL